MTAPLLTTPEAAAVLRVSSSWLKKAAAAGVVPCTRIGRGVRFSEENLAEIVANGQQRVVTSLRRRSA